MPVDLDKLRRDLKSKNADVFCKDYLFSDEIYIFEEHVKIGIQGSSAEFRAFVADKLDTNPMNINVVGSAKIGYSLNPTKDIKLSPFRYRGEHMSDIDMIVVNDEYFTELWKRLLKLHYNSDANARRKNSNNIFQHFTVLNENTIYEDDYIKDLIKLFLEMKRDIQSDFRIDYKINYRIYRSWDSALEYHKWGVNELKKALGHA